MSTTSTWAEHDPRCDGGWLHIADRTPCPICRPQDAACSGCPVTWKVCASTYWATTTRCCQACTHQLGLEE